MLKRYDIYRSIADDVLIPKMLFLSKSVDAVKQSCNFVFDLISFSLAVLLSGPKSALCYGLQFFGHAEDGDGCMQRLYDCM